MKALIKKIGHTVVSANKASSVTLDNLAIKNREYRCSFVNLNQRGHPHGVSPKRKIIIDILGKKSRAKKQNEKIIFRSMPAQEQVFRRVFINHFLEYIDKSLGHRYLVVKR